MKTLLLTGLLGLGIVCTSTAQNLAHIYNYQGENALRIETTDNGFQILTNPTDNSSLHILTLDEDGQLMGEESFDVGQDNFSFVNGHFYKIDHIDNNGHTDILYSKYDIEGNQLWEKTLERSLENYGVKVIATQDGHLLLAGITQVGGDRLYTFFLTKMDEDGNVLWQRVVDKSYVEYDRAFGYAMGFNDTEVRPFEKPGLNRIWSTKDGGFLIQNIHGVYTPAAFRYHNWIKTDAWGNVLWSHSYLNGSKNIPTPVPNWGTYLESGNHVDSYEDGSVVVTHNAKIGTAQYLRAKLIKFAPDGEILIEKGYGGGSDWPAESYTIEAREEGGFHWVVEDGTMHQYGVGYLRNSLMLYSFSGAMDYPVEKHVVLDFDITGLTDISTGNFHDGTYHSIKDITIVDDESIALLGEIGENNDWYHDNSLSLPFFLKLDLNEFCAPTQEELVFFGTYNGHDYYLSALQYDFQGAKALAASAGGHLVVPNSQGENNFLSSHAYGNNCWLGISDEVVEGAFNLEDGNELIFQNFLTCEPACDNAEELDYAYFNFEGGRWELTENSSDLRYVMVEVECQESDQIFEDITIDPLTTPWFALYDTEPIPLEGEIGGAFEYALTIQNFGSTALETSFFVEAFLSEDSYYDQEDISIGTYDFENLATGLIDTFSITLTVPNGTNIGTYKVIFIADSDDQVEEVDELNNIFIAEGRMEVKEPDSGGEGNFDIGIVNAWGQTIYPTQGEDFKLNVRFENVGDTTLIGPIKIGVFREDSEAPFSTTPQEILDTELWHVFYLDSLPPGITQIQEGIPIPAMEPFDSQFNLDVFADFENDHEELDETNNHFNVVNTFTVSGDYSPNLRVTNIEEVPETLAQGETIPFTFTLSNVGPVEAIGDFRVQIGLTTDGWNMPSDEESEILYFTNFQGTTSQEITIYYTVPGYWTPGEYRFTILVDVDDTISESEEWNYFSTWPNSTITLAANADLTVDNITNLPNSTTQGAVVWFNFDLINQGEVVALGEFDVKMYLNDEESFNPNTIENYPEVGIVATGWTPVGTIPNVGAGITVPESIAPGQYYLIVMADASWEISENNKTNNYKIVPLFIGEGEEGWITLTCPDDISISANGGANGAFISWDESTMLSDNCNLSPSEVNFGQCAGFSNGSYFPIGTTIVVYGAIANCNDWFTTNTSCEFNVTVIEHPIFTNETSIEICPGEIYEGISYFENTTLIDTLYFDNFDSILTTNITVLESYEIFLFGETCDEEEAGIFSEMLIASNGCDSLVITQVDLLPVSEIDLTLELCQDESIIINGTIYDQNNPIGSEIFVGGAINGCDSIVHVSINFFEDIISNILETTCNPENAGTFIETLIAVNGCDSLVIVEVELLPSSEIDIFPSVCEGESIEINGSIYDANNPIGTEMLVNQYGCDSLVHISIDWLENVEEMIELSLMQGALYNGFPIEKDTTIIENHIAQNGCDSTVTIVIDVQPVSINEINTAQKALSVFPNPAQKETVYVQLQAKDIQDWELSIYNSIGQEIINNQKINWVHFGDEIYQFSLSDLKEGAYLVVLSNEEELLSEKLIVVD